MLVVTDILDEGFFTLQGNSVQAVQMGPGDGPRWFSGSLSADGTFTSAELGDTRPFQSRVLSDRARSQLDAQCAQLEKLAWWATRPGP